jgi:hypothetical protein
MLPERGAGGFGLPSHAQRLINAAPSDAEGYGGGAGGAAGAGGSPGGARRRALLAGAAGGLVAIAVLCGVLAWAVPLVPGARAPLDVASAAGTPLPGAAGAPGRLDEAFCLRLATGDLQQHCLAYLNAPGKRRFRVAVEWQRYDSESCEGGRGVWVWHGGGVAAAAAGAGVYGAARHSLLRGRGAARPGGPLPTAATRSPPPAARPVGSGRIWRARGSPTHDRRRPARAPAPRAPARQTRARASRPSASTTT